MRMKPMNPKSKRLIKRATCALGCGADVRMKGDVCKTCRKIGKRLAAKADYRMRKAARSRRRTWSRAKVEQSHDRSG